MSCLTSLKFDRIRDWLCWVSECFVHSFFRLEFVKVSPLSTQGQCSVVAIV